MILAIDLGGTALRFGLAASGRPWHELAAPRPDPFQPADLVVASARALQAWGVEPRQLEGIGLSVAAVVDRQAGMVRRAENLGWGEAHVGSVLRDRFACRIEVETDVFCGALYEGREGWAQGRGCALYVAVGTGVGHAFVIGGKVWRGNGAASAIGHLTVAADGPRCYCGNQGCLCTIASGRAQAVPGPCEPPRMALARALGAAATLMEPDIVILGGGALAQPWFDLAAIAGLVPSFAYPGLRLPELVRCGIAEPNLRGAALLLREAPA